MSLTREILAKLGIDDKEKVDAIMSANGEAIENAKAQAKSEVDSLKTQLESQKTELTNLSKSAETSAETKKALEELQTKFETAQTESTSKLATVQKEYAIKLALKDTGTVNSDLLFGQVKLDNVIIQEDGKLSGLDEQVTSFKESMPYLFQSEEPAKSNPTGKVTIGGNPDPNAGNGEKSFADALGLI